jgi:hypothetical protein
MEPFLGALKISLIAIGLGVVLCVLLFFVRQPDAPVQTPTPTTPPGKASRK